MQIDRYINIYVCIGRVKERETKKMKGFFKSQASYIIKEIKID